MHWNHEHTLEEVILIEKSEDSFYPSQGIENSKRSNTERTAFDEIQKIAQMLDTEIMNGESHGGLLQSDNLVDPASEIMLGETVDSNFFNHIQSASDEQTSLSSYSPVSSPDHGCLSSPGGFCSEDTQMSLIQHSEALNIMDEMSHLSSDEVLSSYWITPTTSDFLLSPVSQPIETPAKIPKNSEEDDISSSISTLTNSSNNSNSGFDLSLAVSSSEFIFTKFRQESELGTEDTFIPHPTLTATSTLNTVSSRPSTQVQMPATKKYKEPPLNLPFPSKHGKYELEILVQPENQHRARYMTEGSRGAVKDQSGENYPTVRLHGYTEPVQLQVFIGSDVGKTKPHGFYQACKVCGKNSTLCEENTVDGTTVIEIEMDPSEDMIARIDCVGILKLRNADVEHRIGLAGKSKKKSTKAKMVFRVNIPKVDGSYTTLQVASNPILCTQPVGTPEICRQSLTECSVNGGADLFLIGKNFSKGVKVFFKEIGENNKVTWQKQGEVESEFFQTTHLICKIPEYRDKTVQHPVKVDVIAQCSGKSSEPLEFTYMPVYKEPKREIASTTEVSTFLTTGVSPEALELQREILEPQQQQHQGANFLLPTDLSIFTPPAQQMPTPMDISCTIANTQDTRSGTEHSLPLSVAVFNKGAETASLLQHVSPILVTTVTEGTQAWPVNTQTSTHQVNQVPVATKSALPKMTHDDVLAALGPDTMNNH